MRGCEIGPSNCAPYRRVVPFALEGLKQRQYSIQPVEGATKDVLAMAEKILNITNSFAGMVWAPTGSSSMSDSKKIDSGRRDTRCRVCAWH